MTQEPAGDAEALKFEDFREELHNYLVNRVRGWRRVEKIYEADDFLADAWMKFRSMDRVPKNRNEACAYLKTCLRNAVIDAGRKEEVRHTINYDFMENHHEFVARPVVSDVEITEDWQAIKAQLDDLSALVAQPWDQGSKRVCLYAVFLMALRFGFGEAISKRMGETEIDSILGTRVGGCGFSEWVARSLKWSDSQSELSYRANWVSIAQIWRALEDLVNDPPHTVQAAEHCVCVNTEHSNQNIDAQLTPERWYQWLKRSRINALEIYGHKNWNRYFAALLGSAPKSSNKTNTGAR